MTKNLFSTENLAEKIHTPEDANALLQQRKAKNQEFEDAAKAAYDAYFDDIADRGEKLAAQMRKLIAQRAGVTKAKELTKRAMVAAAANGSTDALEARQKRLMQFDAQLASLNEQIEAFRDCPLEGDREKFRAAERAIKAATEDNEDMASYNSAVLEEVARRESAWRAVRTQHIGPATFPDTGKLYAHIKGKVETVGERVDRLAKEAADQRERQRLLAEQRARDQAEEEEARQRAARQRPREEIVEQNLNIATGELILTRKRLNKETGKYEVVSREIK